MNHLSVFGSEVFISRKLLLNFLFVHLKHFESSPGFSFLLQFPLTLLELRLIFPSGVVADFGVEDLIEGGIASHKLSDRFGELSRVQLYPLCFLSGSIGGCFLSALWSTRGI